MSDMEIDCSLPENEELDYCEDMDDHEEGDHGHGSPMMANVKYLMTAGFAFVHAALTFGRYRYPSDEYYAGIIDIDDDYWEVGNNVRHLSRAAIFGILFITQALSMAGILVDINMMAWHYGMIVFMLFNLLAHQQELFAYDTAYTKYTQDTNANAAYYDAMEMIGLEQKGWLA